MSWQHPFDKRTITSRFGATANRPTPHRGLDYAPPANTVIPAATEGVVRLIQWSDILGWVVVQSGRDTVANRNVFIGYSHLSCATHGIDCKGPRAHGAHSPLRSTKVGDRKAAGEPVGRVGNTGTASRGAHLHLTIGPMVNSVFSGTVWDPEKFIDEQIAAQVCPTCKRPL
jgi:murein DD-endopeptidase MepM/ murein hydrolase activator NlpD